MVAAFDPVRALNAGERIVDKNGAANATFAYLWQRSFMSADFLNTNKADKSIQIIAGTGLTGGGDLSADRTLAIDLTAEAERIRDVMGVALVADSGITITVDDPGNTITIASSVSAYTAENAQDDVGGILADSSTIDFTYDDATPSITAIVKAGSIGPTQLASTAVAAGTYGDASNVAQFTVDADGRITAAANVAVSGGGGTGGVLPVVDGSIPPVFIQNPDGSLVYTPI
jgi:hypothetical protein